MQTEGDTELFDTEVTIDQLEALFKQHMLEAQVKELDWAINNNIDNDFPHNNRRVEERIVLLRNKINGSDHE